jgi:hypothetical protein
MPHVTVNADRSVVAMKCRPTVAASAVFLIVALLIAAHPRAAKAADVERCGNFVVFRASDSVSGRFHYRARQVKRSGLVECQRVRNLLRAAYGQGPLPPIRKQYARDASGHIFGRPTYWLRGGWRCTNGAGSASCWNAADERYNTITIADVEQRFAIVATVDFVENRRRCA